MCVPACLPVSVCASVCACVLASVCGCVRLCVPACVRTSVCACLCAYVCVGLPACVSACLPACLPACLRVSVSAYLPANQMCSFQWHKNNNWFILLSHCSSLTRCEEFSSAQEKSEEKTDKDLSWLWTAQVSIVRHLVIVKSYIWMLALNVPYHFWNAYLYDYNPHFYICMLHLSLLIAVCLSFSFVIVSSYI